MAKKKLPKLPYGFWDISALIVAAPGLCLALCGLVYLIQLIIEAVR